LIKNSPEYRKSFPNEKIPEVSAEVKSQYVTELIDGKSHRILTEDPTKDVLVMYYAPWCGHCKKLKPVWEELGQHVMGSDVVVAKIDMDANKLKSPSIKGFPTIYFYPKVGESLVYEEGRSLSELKGYLYANSAAYREAFPEEKPKKGAQAKQKKS
jgi:protein disulfide-isomerase-like protein